MRTITVAWAWLMAALAFEAGAAETNLVKAMVRFDQAYIPALALTSVEQREPSRQAYAELMREWPRFRSATVDSTLDSEEWASDLKEVEAHLRIAGRIIADGNQLKEAHKSLEPVRQILMHARERMGIDYYLDHLTRFHEPMETIVLKCKDTPPGQLKPADIEELNTQLRRGQELWSKVKEAQFDAALFDFDENRTARMRQSMAMEDNAMMTLEQSLAEGEADTIVAAGQGLKPPFARCFKLFGRFPGESH